MYKVEKFYHGQWCTIALFNSWQEACDELETLKKRLPDDLFRLSE